jgi:hypothetical protein
MNEEFNLGIYTNKKSNNLEFRKFEKDLLNPESKFIQIYFNQKPYLRIGNLENETIYHAGILHCTLTDFGIKYNDTMNEFGEIIPLEKDLEKGYEMVGAGKVRSFENGTLQFWDLSGDYCKNVNGANKKHLEEIFGKDKIVTIREDKLEPVLKCSIMNPSRENLKS